MPQEPNFIVGLTSWGDLKVWREGRPVYYHPPQDAVQREALVREVASHEVNPEKLDARVKELLEKLQKIEDQRASHPA